MVNKNKFIILALFSLLSVENAHSQWIIEKSPASGNLNSICLLNDNSGWIVGDKGTMVYMSKDGWMKYPGVTDENLYSVFMIDQNNGWSVGSNGTILHFDGKKWEDFACPTSEKLYSVRFRDAEHGIAVGAYGTIVIFEKGTWELVPKATVGDLYAVSVKGNLSLIGGGLEWVNIPIMTMSDNFEKTISNSFDPHFVEIRSFAIPDQENIWAVGRPGTIFHSNGGDWKRLEISDKMPSLNCVFFFDKNHGITVGYSGTIFTFAEDVWTKEVSSVNVKLNGAFISKNKYYAVGDNGTIISLKRVPENESDPISKDFNLIKIKSYPNPTTDNLSIIIPDEGDFMADQISISSVYGKVVFNKRLDPGTGGQVYQVNTSELNDGLYLVNITTTDRKKASGKFIVRH